MSEEPAWMPFRLSDRDHRWLSALLILATLTFAFVVIDYVGKYLTFFNDVIMVFFLAWLLAFILSPLANGLVHLFPRLPRALAVVIVYSLLIVILITAVLLIAQQLYSSINHLIHDPAFNDPEHLRKMLDPLQARLNDLGGGQISLYEQVNQLLTNLKSGANDLTKPLGDIAVASIGIFGNLLFIFFLSLYMAVDRERISRFLFRIVPVNYTDEAQLLEHSVSRSFGGFLRGEALMGIMYGLIAMVASILFGLPYMPVAAVSSGVLQMIPFFGPFVSWTPPVLMAIFLKPDAALPVLIIMVVGWFVLMNIVQPRLMADAVGLHPVVVLGSVMIGSKIDGIPGAIFAVPIAAVIAAFFFYYLGRNRDIASVALRAARLLEEREGHPVRVPRLPQAGEDQEVEPELAADPQLTADPQRARPKRRRTAKPESSKPEADAYPGNDRAAAR
jgi:predicted PurR-regulated permease PerM